MRQNLGHVAKLVDVLRERMYAQDDDGRLVCVVSRGAGEWREEARYRSAC